MEYNFNSIYCSGKIIKNNDFDLILDGVVNDDVKEIYYLAAAPPDFNSSFSGSGLPYASSEQAFYNTPNEGVVKVEDSKFLIKLTVPNSYYKDYFTLIKPRVELMINKNKVNVDIPELTVPYRSLQYPKERKDAMFYNKTLPVRTQEQVLRDSDYPDKQNFNDFWGLKPPL
jgi:hypothetical protein